MRRMITPVLALALLAPLMAAGPATAHADWQIVGYQYVAVEPPLISHGGYVTTPAGAIQVTDGHVDDGIGSITNRDSVPHTFTECTSACDTGAPGWAGARFDVSIPAGGSASSQAIAHLNSLFEGSAGEWIVVCTVHPSMMRARLHTTGD